MDAALLDAPQWASIEFGGARLGDRRLSRRLVMVAADLAKNPQGTLHGAMGDWTDLKAAYRLMANPKATFEAVTEPHRTRTFDFCRTGGDFLLIEDTTELDFTSHRATTDLGRIGDDGGQGLWLHTTLALSIEGWDDEHHPAVQPVGLLDQQCWARPDAPEDRKNESARMRLSRPRESQRWAAAYRRHGGPPHGVRWTHVADRESDIYEVFETCRRYGLDYIVRAYQSRKPVDDGLRMFQAVAERPALGAFELYLRARPGVAARTAMIELRATAITIRAPWRPDGAGEPLTMNVVEAREVDPPANVAPVHWVLVTTWPAANAQEARRVTNAYACRWLIEEYHKALKTGATVEESQLAACSRLQTLIGVLAVVALRLLSMKLIARVHPDEPIPPEMLSPEARTILEHKLGPPKEGWTMAGAITAIARLGGFLARKHDGPPGWKSIWRGWHRLMFMVEGYQIAQSG